MSLKTKVYVSTNNLTDARYCAGMGVDLIEFIVDPEHPEALAKETYLGISQWIEGVEFVGYFSSTAQLEKTCSELNISAICSHDIEVLNSAGEQYKKILKVNIKSLENSVASELEAVKDKVDFFYLESDNISELNSFDFLNNTHLPILLGFGFNDSTVSHVIETSVTGIGLKGSDEERPGFKDMDELADILEAIEIDY